MDEFLHARGDEEGCVDAKDAGIFIWDLETNTLQADTVVAELFGLDAPEVLEGAPVETFLNQIHQADRPKVARSIHEAIVTGGPYHEAYKVMSRKGPTNVVAFGRCFRDAEGNPKQYAGIVFRAGDRNAHDGSLIAHIALAHKLAADDGKAQVADALAAVLDNINHETVALMRSRH